MSAVAHSPSGFDDLSIVIPTLNAEGCLAGCLAGLGEAVGATFLVVDGGSRDGTVALARSHGADVIIAPRGRGGQLRAGTMHAPGPWLLVLHADTCLEAGWACEARAWIDTPGSTGRFAVFQFKLDSSDWRARVVERLVGLRVRWLGLPYGDQGLLIHRDLLARVGGYGGLPLMEDVDLVRRLGRQRLRLLDACAVTSAERWRRDGWIRRSLRNLTCLTLYGAGVSPRCIARLYG